MAVLLSQVEQFRGTHKAAIEVNCVVFCNCSFFINCYSFAWQESCDTRCQELLDIQTTTNIFKVLQFLGTMCIGYRCGVFALKDEFEHKSSHLLGDSFLPLIQQLNDHVVQHEASLLESTKQLRAAVCAELCIAFCIVTVTHCVSLKAEKCEDLVKQHTADQRRSLDVVSNVLQNEKSRQVGTMYMVIACEEKLLIFRYQLFKHTKIALHVHLNNRKLCRR